MCYQHMACQRQKKLVVVKTWLGRNGFHYLDTLMLAEKEAGNMLDGLFDMLAIKFKQFRTLY